MRVGTIGTSVITERMIDALNNTGNEVIAVYSRSKDKGEAFAKKNGVAKVCDDMDQLLADDEIDTIYVASPNSLHYEQSKRALEAGKNVITEKPFTSTKAQAEELFALAEEKGTYLFEAITTMHNPNYEKIRENLDRIGTPTVVSGNYSQYSSRYPKYMQGEITNIFDPKFDGGALQDINVYNIHFITGLFGTPDEVTYYSRKGPNGIDTSGVLVMEYPDFTALAIGAKDASSEPEIWIEGTKGSIAVHSTPGQVRNAYFYPPKGDMTGKKNVDNAESFGIELNKNHMDYECEDFNTIITNDDRNAYNKLKEQTLRVAAILEEAKRQRDNR